MVPAATAVPITPATFGPHRLHQQVIGRVVFQTDYLGYTCCHRYSRYACRTDERVDLVARSNSHDLSKEDAACRACRKGNQTEHDDFNRFQTEEFVAGHCQACACRQEDGDDIDQRILRGIGQSCRYAGYFEKITETQTSHQRRYRRQKQGYDDGYDNRGIPPFQSGLPDEG